MATTATRERPIVLRPAEVRALLADGRATVRRAIEDVPAWTTEWYHDRRSGMWMPNGPSPTGKGSAAGHWRSCPWGGPGQALWGAETWAEEYGMKDETGRDPDAIWYRADGQARFCDLASRAMTGDVWDAGRREAETLIGTLGRWLSPVTMPRWASRLDLALAAVAVEPGDAGWDWVLTMERVDAAAEGHGHA